MKKILLSLIISGTSICSFAQPTMNFETWTGSSVSIEPFGWISENATTSLFPANPQSVFQAVTPNIHSGTYAMQITSVTMSTNPAPTQLPNPIGFAGTGSVAIIPAVKLVFGFPYTARPMSVSFWEKYTPAAGDTAGFLICLTKWNTTVTPQKRDTIGLGIWKTGAATSAFTSQSVTVTYTTTVEIPDSMTLIFSATKLFNASHALCLNCGIAGSNLWIDDINFSGWNGVNEFEMSKGVSVFPNPAHDFATITVDNVSEATTAEVFDITGRLITTIPFSDAVNAVDKKSAIIPTQGMPSGFYSLLVYDKSKRLLRNGKLNVIK